MNFSGVLGVFIAVGVAAYTVITSADNPQVFVDEHGIVIVIGGTLAVAFLSFRMGRLFFALKVLVRKMFGGERSNYLEQIRIIVHTAEKFRQDPKAALNSIDAKSHPFFLDGMKYIVDFGFSADEVDEIMTNAVIGKQKRDGSEIRVWQTVARFPPAFGLLGATVGMIALLQTLGEPGAQDKIGPAMATALVATFYGLVTANLVFIPIGENLAVYSEEDVTMRKLIKEGVLLIQEKRHPLFIEEYLKSFLAPKDRNKDLSSGGGVSGARAA